MVSRCHNKAIELDKYYTREEVALKCAQNISNLAQYDLVVEPSAGAGAFYRCIEHHNKVGLDIEPEDKRVIKQDWLRYRISKKYVRVLVIGNPPFGKMNALSAAFIRHALSFGNVQTIAFILPDVYRKHTRQRVLPDNWRIDSISDVGRDAFSFNGRLRHVPCSFFVFDKSEGRDLRVNPDQHKDKVDFTFGNADDFDVFMFGAAPRRIIAKPEKPEPNNRGHFLKSRIKVDELVRKLEAVDWRGNSCANGGVYWLTQTEVIENYRKTHCAAT